MGKPAKLSYIVLVCLLYSTWTTAVGQEKEHPGKAPYDKVCRICHGPEGMGNQGPALVPLTMEPEELLIRVREGGGEMPPISANRVSDDDVKQIAAYLKSLSPPEKSH
jgi:mono/diheme cytochrome c family protein